jgi:hypothetical protein
MPGNERTMAAYDFSELVVEMLPNYLVNEIQDVCRLRHFQLLSVDPIDPCRM